VIAITTPVVYALLFAATIIYAVALERLHDVYTPDWTWITVVIGNSLIGLALLALCWIGEVSWGAFWHILGLNACAGSVIIAWQAWQAVQRANERRGKK
jgi:uncharacterized membrane protein